MKNFLNELCCADFWTKMIFLVALFVLCVWVIMLIHSVSVLTYFIGEGACIERAVTAIMVFSMLIIIYVCVSILALHKEGIVYFLEHAIAIHFFSMIVVFVQLLLFEATIKVLEFIFD
jgi:hypothetical protein